TRSGARRRPGGDGRPAAVHAAAAGDRGSFVAVMPGDKSEGAVRADAIVRLLTCGSVDDGKSTLLGRLLFDSGAVLDDHLAAARQAPRPGTAGDLDLALRGAGLRAEREQGITIDLAHRHLSTAARRFLLLDAPGHEAYTRNMATGASLA